MASALLLAERLNALANKCPYQTRAGGAVFAGNAINGGQQARIGFENELACWPRFKLEWHWVFRVGQSQYSYG